MSILDEIEGHAIHATRLQASTDKAQKNVVFFRALEKRIPVYKTAAVVGAFIPFVGWAVCMFTYILVFTVTKGGDTKKALTDALTVGVGYGSLSFLITWGTFALGYHGLEGDEMMLFYGLSVLLVYFTFVGCKRVQRLVEITEQAAEHIASQS